jgi:hypothetical protein
MTVALPTQEETTVVLDLRIENHYGASVVVTTDRVQVTVPAGIDPADDYDWSYDEIFPSTGTGRDGDAAYFVEVVGTDNEDIIPNGTEWEFGL